MELEPGYDNIFNIDNTVKNQTLAVSGSNVISVGSSEYKEFTLAVRVNGAVTGTTPTLKFTLQDIDPQSNTCGNSISSKVFTATSATFVYPFHTRTTLMQLSWTVTGTTPSFAGVFASVIGVKNASEVITISSVSGALSVTSTQVQAMVGAVALEGRKMLSITPTNGTIYYGSTSAVTTATGTPIFKNQNIQLSFSDNAPVWLVSAGTIDVRIVEAH